MFWNLFILPLHCSFFSTLLLSCLVAMSSYYLLWMWIKVRRQQRNANDVTCEWWWWWLESNHAERSLRACRQVSFTNIFLTHISRRGGSSPGQDWAKEWAPRRTDPKYRVSAVLRDSHMGDIALMFFNRLHFGISIGCSFLNYRQNVLFGCWCVGVFCHPLCIKLVWSASKYVPFCPVFFRLVVKLS